MINNFISIVDTVSKKNRSKPPNLSSMLDVADRMSHATSVRFTYGVAYQLNEYTADGTIFDFMAGKRKVSFMTNTPRMPFPYIYIVYSSFSR